MDPALTIALEFGDGKILMSNLAAVSNLNGDPRALLHAAAHGENEVRIYDLER